MCIGSGGSTSLAADILEREGLTIPPLPEHAAAQLRAVLPPFVTPQNPLDVAGYSYEDEAELAGVALDTFGADSAFDKLLALVPGLPHIERCVRAVERVRAASDETRSDRLCRRFLYGPGPCPRPDRFLALVGRSGTRRTRDYRRNTLRSGSHDASRCRRACRRCLRRPA